MTHMERNERYSSATAVFMERVEDMAVYAGHNLLDVIIFNVKSVMNHKSFDKDVCQSPGSAVK